MMNFLNMKYFIVTAEELSFTRAAKRLFITQQTLSEHIAKLERYFGTKLFDRNPPVTLTPAGASLYKHALFLVQYQQQAEREIQDVVDFRKSSLNIGITRDRSSCYLPLILPNFWAEYPAIKINLLEGTSDEVNTALKNGRIDLSIGPPPEDTTYIHVEPICEDNPVIIVPVEILKRYFPNCSEYGSLSLDSFKNCPFLAILHSYPGGVEFLNHCEYFGFIPNIVLESKSMQTLMALCRQGIGILVCPQVYIFPYLDQADPALLNNLVFYKMDNYSDLTRRLVAVNYLKSKHLHTAAVEFIKVCEKSLKDAYDKFPITGLHGV
jgi:DNA-binding transcriptional LysR family regulator